MAPEGFTFVGTNDNDDPDDDDELILSLDEVEMNEGADNGTFVEQTEFDDIGNTFAMMEAVLVLTTIAQRVRPTLAPGHLVVPVPSLTLRPKHGMRMQLSEAEGTGVELTSLREERDLIRTRVSEMLEQIESLNL